jgi:hypothetical protein
MQVQEDLVEDILKRFDKLQADLREIRELTELHHGKAVKAIIESNNIKRGEA